MWKKFPADRPSDFGSYVCVLHDGSAKICYWDDQYKAWAGGDPIESWYDEEASGKVLKHGNTVRVHKDVNWPSFVPGMNSYVGHTFEIKKLYGNFADLQYAETKANIIYGFRACSLEKV